MPFYGGGGIGSLRNSLRTAAAVAAAGPAVTYLPTGLGTSYAAVYSLHKLVSSYSGPVASVCASGDSDTPASPMDVMAKADGTPNFAPAIAAFGSTFDIYKAYDQIGQLAPAIQVAAKSRPSISATLFGGFAGYYGGKVIGVAYDAYGWLQLPTTLHTTIRGCATLSVLAGPNNGNDQVGLISLGTSDTSGMLSASASSRGIEGRGNAGTLADTGLDQNPCVFGMRGLANGYSVYHRNEQVLQASNYQSDYPMVGGALGNYGDRTNVNEASTNVARMADIIFSANPSDADYATVKAALKSRFAIPTRTSQVITTGSSIDIGLGQSTAAVIPGQDWEYFLTGGQLTRDPIIAAHGHGGFKYADLVPIYLPGGTNFFQRMFRSEFVRNVLFFGGDTNGLGASDSISTLMGYLNQLTSAASSAGFTVVCGTIIVRSNYTGTLEQKRKDYNTALISGAGSGGYTVANLGDNTYDTVDGTHPTIAGYQAMAAGIKPALNAALA